MTTDLLLRIAESEAAAYTLYGRAQTFGPLTAIDAGAISVLSSAWHSGLRPPTAQELADFERFSRQCGQQPTLHLLSNTAPDVLPLLNERHYGLAYGLHVYAHDLRHLPDASAFDIQPELDPQRWAELSAQGFDGGLEIMQAVAQAEETHLFTAYLDALPAATAALSLTAGVAAFHGTSTLAAFRGRGAQTALLAYRLHAAKELGADLATVFVTPGTASERNIERSGFRLVGMRLTFMQECSMDSESA